MYISLPLVGDLHSTTCPNESPFYDCWSEGEARFVRLGRREMIWNRKVSGPYEIEIGRLRLEWWRPSKPFQPRESTRCEATEV